MSHDTNPDESRIVNELQHLRIEVCLISAVAFLSALFYLYPEQHAGADSAAASLLFAGAVASWAMGTIVLVKRDLPSVRAWVRERRSAA